MKDYQTEQRKALLAFFQENPQKQFSTEELVRALPERIPISRSAIYRNIDKLARDGTLVRSLDRTGKRALYQYAACGGHCGRLHLQCEQCGRLLHLEDQATEAALSDLLRTNGFQLDGRATIIFGLCQNCR